MTIIQVSDTLEVCMYLVTVWFRNGDRMFFRSETEPTWTRVKGKGRRLKVDLPENPEDFDNYNQFPQMAIYSPDLVNATWRQEPDTSEREYTAKQLAMIERDREELHFLTWLKDQNDEEAPPNYSEIREYLGWGQKKVGDFLRDLADRGHVRREKQGRNSLFYVTSAGNKHILDLEERYKEEDE